MRWQVTRSGVPTGDMVDDGLPFEPGEEGFTMTEALKLAKELKGDGVSYMGRSETEVVS